MLGLATGVDVNAAARNLASSIKGIVAVAVPNRVTNRREISPDASMSLTGDLMRLSSGQWEP